MLCCFPKSYETLLYWTFKHLNNGQQQTHSKSINARCLCSLKQHVTIFILFFGWTGKKKATLLFDESIWNWQLQVQVEPYNSGLVCRRMEAIVACISFSTPCRWHITRHIRVCVCSYLVRTPIRRSRYVSVWLGAPSASSFSAVWIRWSVTTIAVKTTPNPDKSARQFVCLLQLIN